MQDIDIIDFDRRGGRRRGRKILIIVLIILAALYVAGAVYFSKHFMPRTTVNSMDASWKTASQMKNLFDDEIDNYTLTIQERGGKTEKISGSGLNLKADFGSRISDGLKKQHAFTWIFRIWQKKDIQIYDLADYDEDALNQAVENLSCMDPSLMTKARSASISKKQTNGKFTITEAVEGTTIKESVFLKKVSQAVSGLDPKLNLEKEGCYESPKYQSDDQKVKDALETVNKLTDITITYDMGDIDPVVNGAEQIRSWLDIDDDLHVTISKTKIAAYVKKFAKKYNTAYTSRKFRTAEGETITTAGGYYGWLLDQKKETNALYQDVKNGKDVSREPNWAQTAVSHKKRDYGNTYAEVDIGSQRMWYIENGKVRMSSYVVTGNESTGHGTPRGVFNIMYKQRNATLSGQGYNSPVSYWMPFEANVGFHDASWRSSFGGSTYKTSGSHGCVNMPPANAAKLYSMIKKGCPVIVHD